MVLRRVALGSAAALVVLGLGVAPAGAAPPVPSVTDDCSFARGTTTCVTTESSVTKSYTTVDGEDGRRVDKGDVTVYGRACQAYEPQTWYYGAFADTTVQVTETTMTTTVYQGRVARHDKKVSSETVVIERDFRVTSGTLYCYTRRVLGPLTFEAPYPS